MDRDRYFQIFSHCLLVLFSISAHVLHTLAADDDVFNTKVKITPSSAVKGQTVEFQCDFTLVDEKDLHLLYWETTNGARLFTYNNDQGTSEVNDKFENKIISYEYIDNVPNGGTWDRRHILKMEVDNCDRATYRCLVLNKEVFNEGSDQQTLEITASLPDPEICLKIDGKCHTGSVYRENTTTLTVTCKVLKSSVEPGMKLMKITKDTGEDGEEVETTPTIEHLEGCLHNGDLESGELVVKIDVGTTFRCEVNYGGTDRSSEASITFANPCDSLPCQHGGTCVDIDSTQFNCTCPESYHGDTCENKSGGSDDCEGFFCDEWKIILICCIVGLVLIVCIAVGVFLLCKKSNALCAVSPDSVDNGKKPLGKSNGDIESGGGAPVRSGTPFDVEVNSLNASRGPEGGKPGGASYENPAMENERPHHYEDITNRSSASRLPDVEVKPPESPRSLPAVGGVGVMTSSSNGRPGRLTPIDGTTQAEDGDKKKRKKKKKKRSRKEGDSKEESRVSYDNAANDDDVSK